MSFLTKHKPFVSLNGFNITRIHCVVANKCNANSLLKRCSKTLSKTTNTTKTHDSRIIHVFDLHVFEKELIV